MAQLDHLTGITIFVAAARARSFTDAAERLGMSKSAVGKSIARLEQRLGVKLFHRTTRKVTLTEDGAAYFASCADALDGIADAELALQSGQQTPAGRLRIDMPAAYGRGVVLPVLAEIARQYPALTLTMTFSDDLSDPFAEGIDLLIRFGEVPDSSGLVAKQLGSQREVLCATPAYLAASGSTPACVADLDQHACIVGYRHNTPMKWRVMDEMGMEVRFAPPPTYLLSDGDAVLTMVLAGCGICQLSEFMVREHLRSGALVSLMETQSVCRSAIYAVWPQTRHLLPKLRRVIDVLSLKAQLGLLG